jgi:hypothetical protein
MLVSKGISLMMYFNFRKDLKYELPAYFEEKYGYPENRDFAQWCLSEFGRNLCTRVVSKCFYTYKGLKNRLMRKFAK